VKCDAGAPCNRCVHSGLRCTRDIIRKRRGPKKGSGSVIARLRTEHDVNAVDGSEQPISGLPTLDIRPGTRESSYSPLPSPLTPSFGDPYGPTSMPYGSPPRSVPVSNPVMPAMGGLPFGQRYLPPWQLSENAMMLRYASPPSTDGYVSVNDLAHQIFDVNGELSMEPLSMQDPLPPTQIAGTNLVNSSGITSPASSASFPYEGPKHLYRSDSGTFAEPRIQSLAHEIRMSAYLMSQCVKQYFRHLYPIMPVLHELSYRQRLCSTEDLTPDEKCLLLSICAVTVLHAAPPSDLTLEAKKDLGRHFLARCFEIRHTYDWIEAAGLNTMITSFFISISYMELKQIKSHHFYLRESIGMALDQGLQLETTYKGLDFRQKLCSRRMFALLFVTERGCAILRNKPILITRLPRLPSKNFDDEDPSILAGFICLCRLFALLDESFVDLWRSADSALQADADQLDNIALIQHELAVMSFEEYGLTDIQQADVLITQQWLRLIFWQASTRQGLVSSSAVEPAFSYDYPIVIAKDLCLVMQRLPLDAILVHGLGIFEKIFEVAYSLMDALTITGVPWANSEELRYLFSCLSASANSHNTYVKMLESKFDGSEKQGVGQTALDRIASHG
jgi:hypothetical protein